MWTYDPKNRTTGPDNGPLRRVQLEAAAEKLLDAGITNQWLVRDILSALSEVSQPEVNSILDQIGIDRMTQRNFSSDGMHSPRNLFDPSTLGTTQCQSSPPIQTT